MDELKREAAPVSADRFNIRFMTLGVFMIFATLFGSEKLVLQLVDPDTQAFLSGAMERVAAADITPEEKDAIRQETLSRLATPPIYGVVALVLFAPMLVGLLLGRYSGSVFSAPIAVILGVWVTLAMDQAISAGAIAASIGYACLSLPAVLGVKKWMARAH